MILAVSISSMAERHQEQSNVGGRTVHCVTVRLCISNERSAVKPQRKKGSMRDLSFSFQPTCLGAHRMLVEVQDICSHGAALHKTC